MKPKAYKGRCLIACTKNGECPEKLKDVKPPICVQCPEHKVSLIDLEDKVICGIWPPKELTSQAEGIHIESGDAPIIEGNSISAGASDKEEKPLKAQSSKAKGQSSKQEADGSKEL